MDRNGHYIVKDVAIHEIVCKTRAFVAIAAGRSDTC